MARAAQPGKMHELAKQTDLNDISVRIRLKRPLALGRALFTGAAAVSLAFLCPQLFQESRCPP